jgi:hypothetical protein
MPTTIPKVAEHQRDRRASPITHAPVGSRRQREYGQRHEAADEVIAGHVPGCGCRKESSAK